MNVLTLPEVTIESLPAVEISGLVSVTVPECLTVTAEQPIDVNVLTLPEINDFKFTSGRSQRLRKCDRSIRLNGNSIRTN